MTLCSFMAARPPAWSPEVAIARWTTASTSALASSRAISGVRMSTARSSTPASPGAATIGVTVSTPITRSTSEWAASRPATWAPRYRPTPVTRTTFGVLTRCASLKTHVRKPGRAGPLLTQTATLNPGLAQQLPVLFLGHTLAALLDHRAHTTSPLKHAGYLAGPRVARCGPDRKTEGYGTPF